MAIIAKKILLYQQAFQLARDHVPKDRALMDKAGIVSHLHDAIRQEIALGTEDPVGIAASAVRALQRHVRS